MKKIKFLEILQEATIEVVNERRINEVRMSIEDDVEQLFTSGKPKVTFDEVENVTLGFIKDVDKAQQMALRMGTIFANKHGYKDNGKDEYVKSGEYSHSPEMRVRSDEPSPFGSLGEWRDRESADFSKKMSNRIDFVTSELEKQRSTKKYDFDIISKDLASILEVVKTTKKLELDEIKMLSQWINSCINFIRINKEKQDPNFIITVLISYLRTAKNDVYLNENEENSKGRVTFKAVGREVWMTFDEYKHCVAILPTPELAVKTAAMHQAMEDKTKVAKSDSSYLSESDTLSSELKRHAEVESGEELKTGNIQQGVPVGERRDKMKDRLSSVVCEDENGQFNIGDKVMVTFGSGIDSGKDGIIVDKSEVRTKGNGIPTNVQGAYKPIDWNREVAIRLKNGKLITMFKNRVQMLKKASDANSDVIVGSTKPDDQITESIPPGFPKKVSDKILSQYKGSPNKAYATMWKLHNKHGNRLEESWIETENRLKTLKESKHKGSFDSFINDNDKVKVEYVYHSGSPTTRLDPEESAEMEIVSIKSIVGNNELLSTVNEGDLERLKSEAFDIETDNLMSKADHPEPKDSKFLQNGDIPLRGDKYSTAGVDENTPQISGKGMTRDNNPFLKGYITALLWSETDNSTPSGGEPLDKNYDSSDIDVQSLEKIKRDCDDFVKNNESNIELAYGTNIEHAGHDFILSRNGHGTGFFDHDNPDNDPAIEKALNELQATARKMGECNAYVGDDGKIHVT